MLIIVALNMREANYWMKQENINPINTTILFTTDPHAWQKMRGRVYKQEDRIMYVGRYYEGQYAGQLAAEIDMWKGLWG